MQDIKTKIKSFFAFYTFLHRNFAESNSHIIRSSFSHFRILYTISRPNPKIGVPANLN